MGTSLFLMARSTEGAAIGILCWLRTAEADWGRSLEDQVSVFNASGRQLLYQLSCPKQLHDSFMQLQMQATTGSQDQESPSQQSLKDPEPTAHELLLAPNQELLAVIWQHIDMYGPQMPAERIVRVGLSIHSAITGDLQHSMLLTEGYARNCQLSWLLCSLNLMYVSAGGLLHVMTSSGCQLWSHARAARNPDLDTVPMQAGDTINTTLNASPCGRWILVLDAYVRAPQPSDQGTLLPFARQITILEASTARTLAQCPIYSPRPVPTTIDR